MLNKDFISASVPTLSLDDTIFQALQLMGDYHISHLPVIEDEKYVGLVSEDELINAEEDTGAIKTLQADFSKLSVNANKHFSEAVRLLNENSISVMPVIDNETNWVGAITVVDLLKGMGKLNGVDEPGGIIILELDKRDFSFSQISKLVEANDADITQLNTTYDSAQGTLTVTIKINKLEVSAIVATFQRYDYVVKYYFGEELYENELKTNYDHLINYLNI
ncbi:MAG: CBS domain-containing protein [Williamsia sp.]|nr:CBS domain-containing protein [Williamsia sp.]